MNAFAHFIPTPDTVYPSYTERTFTGYSTVAFNLCLCMCDLFDLKKITCDGLLFGSMPTQQAWMGGTWADVFAHRTCN